MTRMSLPTPTLHTFRLRLRPVGDAASLGYCFDDAAWGHGYATEAARALLRWAFDTLDLNRVQDSWIYGLIQREWRPLA